MLTNINEVSTTTDSYLIHKLVNITTIHLQLNSRTRAVPEFQIKMADYVRVISPGWDEGERTLKFTYNEDF